MKTYLFSYGSYYSSLSLKQLSEMFELPEMQVMLGQDIHTMLMFVSCRAQTHSQDKASDQGMMSSSAVACLCKLWLFTCLALDMFAHGLQLLCDPFDCGVDLYGHCLRCHTIAMHVRLILLIRTCIEGLGVQTLISQFISCAGAQHCEQAHDG